MKIEIYHNPRCTKSRQALSLLVDKGADTEVKEYLKEPLDASQLAALLNKLGMKAKDLIRTGEAIYKSQFKGKELNEQAWIQAMIDHPKLMERPIVVKGKKAVVARPTEKLLELL